MQVTLSIMTIIVTHDKWVSWNPHEQPLNKDTWETLSTLM